jgi:hypothetical protein
LDSVATPIVAGAALHVGNVLRSRNELEARKRLRLVAPGAVTEESVSRSEIRHHAVLFEHASASVHPGGLAPHWFAAAIQPLTAQVAAQGAAITARLDNQQIHRKNRRSIHANADNVDGNAPRLSQVIKTIAGAGPGLPGLPPILAPVPAPQVGALPGPPFPATIAAFRALTALQLHQLSAFYNDTFGIMAGNAPDVQLELFKAFICGN